MPQTQLMRGATPPTNQIQAATLLTDKGNHYATDPTNEGCDAPHQPDSSSYIINKERKLLCDKD